MKESASSDTFTFQDIFIRRLLGADEESCISPGRERKERIMPGEETLIRKVLVGWPLSSSFPSFVGQHGYPSSLMALEKDERSYRHTVSRGIPHLFGRGTEKVMPAHYGFLVHWKRAIGL